MLMTQNKIMEGYHALIDEFNVSPESATEAMGIVVDFCRNQRCPECATGTGECIDCKGRQVAEYKKNAAFYGHANDEILETIKMIGSAAKESNQTAEDLVEDIKDLKIKISKMNDLEDGLEISEEFFQAVDQVNMRLNRLNNFDDSALADRICSIEQRVRNPATPAAPFDISKRERMPIPEKKTILTDYEQGRGWAGSDMAEQAMRRHY